jgi:hypothetical protein
MRPDNGYLFLAKTCHLFLTEDTVVLTNSNIHLHLFQNTVSLPDPPQHYEVHMRVQYNEWA